MKNLFLAFLFLFSSAVSAETFFANTQSTITATTTSTMFLGASSKRNYLRLTNTGAVTVAIKFGSAQTGTEGIQLAAGATYEPAVIPRDSIYMVVGATTTTVYIVEGTDR